MKIDGALCAVCGMARPLAALIKVTSKVARRPTVHFVCRPSVEGQDPNCFRRGTCWVGHHSISLAA